MSFFPSFMVFGAGPKVCLPTSTQDLRSKRYIAMQLSRCSILQELKILVDRTDAVMSERIVSIINVPSCLGLPSVRRLPQGGPTMQLNITCAHSTKDVSSATNKISDAPTLQIDDKQWIAVAKAVTGLRDLRAQLSAKEQRRFDSLYDGVPLMNSLPSPITSQSSVVTATVVKPGLSTASNSSSVSPTVATLPSNAQQARQIPPNRNLEPSKEQVTKNTANCAVPSKSKPLVEKGLSKGQRRRLRKRMFAQDATPCPQVPKLKPSNSHTPQPKKYQHPAKDRLERHRYNDKILKNTLPAVRQCLGFGQNGHTEEDRFKDVVLISIDFENTERLLGRVQASQPIRLETEMGVSLLDTKLLDSNTVPVEELIRGFNFSTALPHKRASQPAWKDYFFRFGQTEYTTIDSLSTKLNSLIDRSRNNVLIAHSAQVELEVLRHLKFDLDTGISAVVCTHALMCSVYLGPDYECCVDGRPTKKLFDSTLQGLCRKLGMDVDRWPESFHVGGNDANYTLKATLLLAIEAFHEKKHLMSSDQLKKMSILEEIALARLPSLGAVRRDCPEASEEVVVQADEAPDSFDSSEVASLSRSQSSSTLISASASQSTEEELMSSCVSDAPCPRDRVTMSVAVPITVAETGPGDTIVGEVAKKDTKERSKERKGTRYRFRVIWKKLVRK
ncbi:uncharacterized protein RSE6_14736 [Rhynchosporium secalis]|uniref:Gfd2/YDR514C-like C-terminal domain-containing protein n=1 Tax=Rhynchosporium secalis TaxID=38038 RepID=A0A1E1MW15_RHYSE|nr:uncharacterized protein RSE6_14736 [Rhynchosporium secalis]